MILLKTNEIKQIFGSGLCICSEKTLWNKKIFPADSAKYVNKESKAACERECCNKNQQLGTYQWQNNLSDCPIKQN